jgi:hypothetical protein
MVQRYKFIVLGHEITYFVKHEAKGKTVLAHWNNSPQVEISLHSDTLFWLRANQYLLFLSNAACLAEKQQHSLTQSIKSGYWKKRVILILEYFI